MTSNTSTQDDAQAGTALIVGGGPGVSASCARLFSERGMRVAVAARNPDKPVLQSLESTHQVLRFACDAADPDAVAQLFDAVSGALGTPRLVVHNIDGRMRDIFRKPITEAAPDLALTTLRNSTFSAFLVAQQAARHMLASPAAEDGHRGTLIFTNASAAFKGYPLSGAFAMASHGKSGLAQSLARELMPQGIHVAHVPHRCRHRLDPAGRPARTRAGGHDRGRQHGRSGSHRGNLLAAASAAPLYLGVRGRAASVDGNLVTASRPTSSRREVDSGRNPTKLAARLERQTIGITTRALSRRAKMHRYLAAVVGLTAMLVIDAVPAAPGEIEEIIVTARKREESMQDIPVAIQAFDAEQINRYAATNLNELADLAVQVGMYPGSSGNGANMVIRGYGSTSLDPGIEGSVGVNIDGVQSDRGHIIRQAFFDLQSVEILKGPQALFFGKNSPAGVVAATSALPSDQFEFKVSAGYEIEAEERLIEGVLSGPLSESLGARLAIRFSDSDGWIDNTAPFVENSNGELFPAEPFDFPGGANDLGAEELFAARLTFDWQPNDTFRGIWRILYTDMENDGFQTPENNNCSGPLPITQGVQDPNGDCKLDGKQAHGSLPRELAAAYSIDIGNGDPFGNYESVLSSLNLEFDLGWATLTSVTGYLDYDYERWDNFDGTSFIQLMGIQVEDQEQWSEEIRLLTQFDGSVNFMIGGFYETFERNSDNAGKIENLGFDIVTGFSNTWEGISTVDSTTLSFFGQVIWDINDRLELTAGVRYTDDDKEAEQGNVYVKQNDLLPGILPGFGFDDILSPAGLIIESDFEDDEFSPEVTLTWRPTDDVTVWAAYKTGYKSGGFSTNTVLSAASTGASLTFDPETADGGEIGIKSMLLEGSLRLNATLYAYTFDDIQISVFDSATTSFSVDNAASATTTGIEVEATYLVSDGLILRAQLGYNKGEYDDFPDAACSVPVDPACDPVTGLRDLSDEPLTRAPEWQGSIGFDYQRPISDGWLFRGAAEAIYSDDYQTNTNNNPLAVQDDFWRLNARVGLQSADGTWDFSLIGRNLDDELYQGGQADKPGGVDGRDLFGGVVRGRQVIFQASYSM